ncbi:fused (3R)-hydroxyacyl-ACP dehydratase subunits HadA/HadB [Nocardia sp. Marseille-Q1738]
MVSDYIGDNYIFTTAMDPAEGAQSAVGRRYRTTGHYTVGREKIREFAQAVQDYHPMHWAEDVVSDYGYDDLVASPTFYTILCFHVQAQMFDSIIPGYPLDHMMHTSQTVRYYKPVHPGDDLAVEVELESFRRAIGGDILVFRYTITDEHDDLAIIARSGVVARSETDRDLGDLRDRLMMHAFGPHGKLALLPISEIDFNTPKRYVRPSEKKVRTSEPTRSLDSLSVGDPLPPRTVRLTLGDLVNYAGVSGDSNPIHWSSDLTGMMNLEYPIAHGMLTIGIGAGFLSSWTGDPVAIREYTVRLTSPVVVTAAGVALEYSGAVQAIDPINRIATVSMSAGYDGRKIFGQATATVQLR